MELDPQDRLDRAARRELAELAGLHWSDPLDVASGFVEATIAEEKVLSAAYQAIPRRLVRIEVRCCCAQRHLLAKVVQTARGELFVAHNASPRSRGPIFPNPATEKAFRRSMGRLRTQPAWLNLGKPSYVRLRCRCGRGVEDGQWIRDWIRSGLLMKARELVIPSTMAVEHNAS